jgi:hypothetical protein
MANELLGMAFETIELSNMAWMVTSGVNALTEDKKPLAELVDKTVASFPENLDFIDNVVIFQPLGLSALPKSHKSTLNNEKLVELARDLKNVAVEKKSKEVLLKANKILKTFEIVSTYLKNRDFFEKRSAKLSSSNPHGQFKG